MFEDMGCFMIIDMAAILSIQVLITIYYQFYMFVRSIVVDHSLTQ
jgi:hypothetical protein